MLREQAGEVDVEPQADAVRVDGELVPFHGRPTVRPSLDGCRRPSMSSIIPMTPTVIAESATLNAQKWYCRQ